MAEGLLFRGHGVRLSRRLVMAGFVALPVAFAFDDARVGGDFAGYAAGRRLAS